MISSSYQLPSSLFYFGTGRFGIMLKVQVFTQLQSLNVASQKYQFGKSNKTHQNIQQSHTNPMIRFQKKLNTQYSIYEKQLPLRDYIKFSMNKHILADILYQKSLQRHSSQRLTACAANNKQKIITKTPFAQQMPQDSNSNMIKISNFASNITQLKRPSPSHLSSPHKQFQIKRISEGRKSSVQNYNYVEIELKRKGDSRQKMLGKDTEETQLNTNETNKILITSKYNFKNDIVCLDLLTSHISSTQSVVIVRPHQQKNLNSPQGRAIIGTAKDLIQMKESGKTQPKQWRREPLNVEHLETSPNKEDIIIRKMSASPRKQYNRHINEQKKYQQNIEKEKKQMLEIRKELNKNYAKPFTPPQNVTASSYIIYQADLKKTSKLRKCSARRHDAQQYAEIKKMFLHSHQVIVSLNSRTAMEIASLTKIMTCIVAIEIATKYSIPIDKQCVTIGLFEQNIGGTSAGVKKGQIYTIKQLLYGLMLPSGNDASVALAVWGGKLLLQQQQLKKQKEETVQSGSKVQINQFCYKKRQCYDRFISYMNGKAMELNMQKTKYCNSHGLSNTQNRSCTLDLCILCEHAMNNKLFRQIVSCKTFETEIQIQGESLNTSKQLSKENSIRDSRKSLRKKMSLNNITPEDSRLQLQQMKDLDQINQDSLPSDDQPTLISHNQTLTKSIRWENTHQLLQDKSDLYTGIKTGVTGTAGPCLASSLEIKGRRFIIIVLNSKNMKSRMKDTEILRRWLFFKESIKYNQKPVVQQEDTSP